MTIFEISILGIQIAPTYYGLMYGVGFIFTYLIIKRAKILSEKEIDNLIFFGFLGVLLGGRIGYILFYNLNYYIENTNKIFKIWEGGMSFHGGFIGVCIAVYLFCKIYKKDLLKIADKLSLGGALAIGFGRIGNYINSELYGFEYSGPLAMKIGEKSYFPAPLLESFLEGLVLFVILLLIQNKAKMRGVVFGSFMLGYGFFRIIAEFFRQPDAHIGYLYGSFLTMGQLLTLPIILVGILLLLNRKNALLK